jgi:phage baseplate assembly protein W
MTKTSIPQSFLGTGWSFPPEFVTQPTDGGAIAGQVVMTSDEQDIEASLRILLSTGEGERFLNPKYGLDLRDQLFEALSTTARTYLEDRVRDNILIYEPRIEILRLALVSGREIEGVVLIEIEYRVRSTNSRYNLVFPFYQTGDAIELSARGAALAAPAA